VIVVKNTHHSLEITLQTTNKYKKNYHDVVVWLTAPCSLVRGYKHFGSKKYCLSLQDRSGLQIYEFYRVWIPQISHTRQAKKNLAILRTSQLIKLAILAPSQKHNFHVTPTSLFSATCWFKYLCTLDKHQHSHLLLYHKYTPKYKIETRDSSSYSYITDLSCHKR
jgi:hypothetical protein